MKKTLLYLFIILFLVSIYKDMTIGTQISEDKNEYSTTVDSEQARHFQAIKIKVQPGETVLSIAEQLNEFENTPLVIDDILTDFKTLNPNVNPYDIKSHSYYFFPLYKE
ncbi:hypothetical protein ACFSTA_12140 [Ornithinibacillus salinisoli]|uniref:LysM domain-containing protein n=1 Tax=Ornithinibacillus salinisoli TaxID=1848459 RepID=A0ABW4W4P2_9BACI